MRNPIAAPLLGVLVLLGCASAEERQRSATGPVTIEVTNHHLLDVNVFAVAGSQRVRLGTVTTNAERVFELPPAIPLTSTLRFLVDPIGSRQGYLSDGVVVSRGDTVVLEIGPDLDLSATSVR